MSSATTMDGSGGHEAAHHTSLPIDNRKLAIWTFIGSECLFFASLISTFLIYRGQSVSGPTPKEIFEVPLVTGGHRRAALLLLLRGDGAQRRPGGESPQAADLAQPHGALRLLLRRDAGLRIQPLLSRGAGLLDQHLRLDVLHADRVPRGPRARWAPSGSRTLLKDACKGKLPKEKALNLEIAALYWHFVDVVWIIIFPVVYLMSLGR